MLNEFGKEFEKNYPLPPHKDNTCPSVGYQDVMVCVPVDIKPIADVSKVKAHCLGEPDVKCFCSNCERDKKHECGKKHTCKLIISQKVRVEVPVIFGAKTEVGEATIECKESKSKQPFGCKDYEIEE